MIRPIVSSWLAEIVPTWAIIEPLTGLDWAFSDATMAATAFVDAAFELHGVGAGG